MSSQLPLPGYGPLGDAIADLITQYGYDSVRRTVAMFGPARSVPSAPARATDPETSHLAGPRSLDVSRFSARSRQAKLLAVFAGDPMTDQQAAVRVVGAYANPSAFDGCRRRCSDLRAAGYLADTGLRRKNVGSDDESIVWRITHAGAVALANLERFGWSR